MDRALGEIKAGVLLAAEDSGEEVARFTPDSAGAGAGEALAAAAARFAGLDRLAANLKMGPIQQLVAVGDEAELAVRRADARAVSIARAPTLDRAYVAQDYAARLLQ